MSIGRRTVSRTAARGYSSRKLAPTIEVIESRQMLAAGFGVIAGTAFVDVNKNDTLTTTDPYLPGATIELFQSGSTTPIATRDDRTPTRALLLLRTSAPGHVHGQRDAPRPARRNLTGTQILSQVEQATALPNKQIQVTVPASPLYLNYNGVQAGTFQVSNNLVNGNAVELDLRSGAFDVTLGSTSERDRHQPRVPHVVFASTTSTASRSPAASSSRSSPSRSPRRTTVRPQSRPPTRAGSPSSTTTSATPR